MNMVKFLCDRHIQMNEKIHTGQRQYDSLQYGGGFVYHSCQLHKIKHSGEITHCNQCDKVFARPGVLKRYIRNQCGKVISRCSHLQTQTRTYFRENQHVDVINVVKHFHMSLLSKLIIEHTLERNPMNVINVVKLSQVLFTFKDI